LSTRSNALDAAELIETGRLSEFRRQYRLLVTCACIDLNPVTAGIAPTPKKSPHMSIKSRVDHCEAQGKLDTRCGGLPYASKVNVEKGHWLLPFEDRRDKNGEGLPGMLHNISLSGYLQ